MMRSKLPSLKTIRSAAIAMKVVLGRERRRAEGELEAEREVVEELGELEARLTAVLRWGYEVDGDDGD